MIQGHIVIHIGAEVEVRIPATWRYKHYSKDETDDVIQRFIEKLGYDSAYLEESEDEIRS